MFSNYLNDDILSVKRGNMSQSSYKQPVSVGIPLIAVGLLIFSSVVSAKGELRVCADPDNLPFSNRQQQGFENKIAAVLARDLHKKLSYYWLRQKQGFIRQTLGAEVCDVVIGVPYGYERVLSTQPYYRSGYVFVSAKRQHLRIDSFDDPILRQLKIGLHTIGNDGANSPPASALGRRGIVNNIVGYSMWGDVSVKNPQGQIIDAVAKGDIDVAIVWGPIGGFFAKKYAKALEITPAPSDAQMTSMPFAFDIAMGVRKGDTAFQEQLEKSITRKQRKIENILTEFNIPIFKLNTGSIPSKIALDPVVNQKSQ